MINKFALVRDGVVQTTIQTDKDKTAFSDIANSLIACGDEVKDNWLYDGQTFSDPSAITVSPQELYTIKIQNAIDGFNTMMIQYVVTNVLAGITQRGKTQLIADALADVQRYGQSGSLYAVITALQKIQLTPEMDPFLNDAVIADLIQKAKDILNSL